MTTSTLQSFATKLVAKNHFVKASWAGFAGTGKTTGSSDFVVGAYKDMGLKKPVLYIDNEKGARFLIPFFEKNGIEVLLKETVNLADVLDAIEFLRRGEVDFLYIDSLTKVWYQFVRDYKNANKVSKITLEHWGHIIPAWQEQFSDRFVDVEGNFVFTGRGGFEYEKEEDSERPDGSIKKGQFVKSGVKMKLAGETPFEPDLNVWMELVQELGPKGKLTQFRTAHVLKDRNRSETSLDGKIFKNPKYKDFRPFVQFVMRVPTGKVAGPSNDTNLAPSEDYAYQKRKQARQIEIEKIGAIFDKAGFGTSKDDKALKVMICEKIFGTASATEIEKMDAEALNFHRQNLEQLFERLTDPANQEQSKAEIMKNFKPADKKNPLGL